MNRRNCVAAFIALIAILPASVPASADPRPKDPAPGPSVPGVPAPKADAHSGSSPAVAAGTGFTYQGRLATSGSPANGQYDMLFTLYDLPSGGIQQGMAITVTNQTVTGGLFTVQLDFGSSPFSGFARYLEISVRQSGGGTFTTLSPRQPITATPYALSLLPGAVIQGSNTLGALVTAFNSANSGSGLQGSGYIGVFGTGEIGVYGNTSLSAGVGVVGNSTGPSLAGVRGFSDSNGDGTEGWAASGYGIYGNSTGSTGVYGTSGSSSSYGVEGVNTAGGTGVHGTAQGYGYGAAVQGDANDYGDGVRGIVSSTVGYGVDGINSSSGGTGAYGRGTYGVHGVASTNGGYGVFGTAVSGTGVVGVSSGGDGVGVYGYSSTADGKGLYGTGDTGVYADGGNTGVFALGNNTAVYAEGLNTGVSGRATGPTGIGVLAQSDQASGIAVKASNPAGGVALQVDNGSIKVSGANPTAFVQVATTSNTSGHITYINNPLTNGDPNAMLFVTADWNPGGSGGVYDAHPVGVFYSGGSWAIFNEDIAAMPTGAAFNVLVVKR